MTSNYKQNNIIKKAKYSYDGLKSSFKGDFSVRLAYYVSVPLSLIFFILSPDLITKLISLFIFMFWIIFEHINTAFETVVDRISLKKHKLSKIAKDIPAYVSGVIVVFYIISIIILSFIIKFSYDDYKNNNSNSNFGDYIKNSFKK